MEFDDSDFQVLQKAWRVEGDKLVVMEQDRRSADNLLDTAGDRLAVLASNMGLQMALIDFPGAKRGYEIIASNVCGSMVKSADPLKSNSSASPDLTGLGLPRTYLKDANYEQVSEFMSEMRRRGYIVTATDMMSNHCLLVNDLQAPDRGGGWKGKDWIGLNFLMLWKDSFTPGRFNYFEQLVNTVQSDWFIPDFEYLLRSPTGDLRRYWSSYLFAGDFLDTAVRICVSQPGNWELVESHE